MRRQIPWRNCSIHRRTLSSGFHIAPAIDSNLSSRPERILKTQNASNGLETRSSYIFIYARWLAAGSGIGYFFCGHSPDLIHALICFLLYRIGKKMGTGNMEIMFADFGGMEGRTMSFIDTFSREFHRIHRESKKDSPAFSYFIVTHGTIEYIIVCSEE